MLKGNEIVYQIFVRNYSNEGTFNKVKEDLHRIKSLGVDIIYLMPIHEIGIKNRKGTYGSPYAIKDYFSITPDYGTKEDFINLINKTHELGMKIILDMVFNHTSPDNVLLDEHPEYYFYRDGHLANRVGDWSDIVDLDTYRDDTDEYLISVLEYWVNLGVDGFRFDVASMIPLEFFKKARERLKNDVIFIGESIDYEFSRYLKSVNDKVTDDIDMFPTFDALYNYSWFRELERYLKGISPIDDLVTALNNDEYLLYNKGLRLNCLENHDNDRVAQYLKGDALNNITDFLFYIKGLPFIYMGQEYGIDHKPELFEKDVVPWKDNPSIYQRYKELINIKKKDENDYHQIFVKVDENTIEVLKEKNCQIIDRKTFTLK